MKILNNTTFWVVFLVLLLLVSIYFLGKRTGNDINVDWTKHQPRGGSELSNKERQRITALAEKTRGLLTNYLFWSQDERCNVYKEILDLGGVLIPVFCSVYADAYKTTLRQDIASTYVNGCSLLSTNYEQLLIEKLDFLRVP